MKKVLLLLILVLICNCVYAATYGQRLKEISNQAVKNCVTLEDKICALREFVHSKMRPPDGDKKPNGELIKPEDIYPLNALQRLDFGYGWCDQSATVFMELAKTQGITTRLVWLYGKKGGPSCHAIAEAFNGNKWVVVDTLFNLELYDINGKMASRLDLAKDMNIIRNSPTVKELIKKESRWKDDEFLSIYTNPASIAYELKGE